MDDSRTFYPTARTMGRRVLTLRAALVPLAAMPLGVLLAQAEAVPGAAGAAGWAGFVTSGGVLLWLLFSYLPKERAAQEKREGTKDAQLAAKDAQMLSVITSRDDLLREQLGLERQGCERRHQQNLELWKEERDARQRQHQELMTEFQQTHAEAKEERHAINNLAGLVTNLLTVFQHFSGLKLEVPPPPPEKGGRP